VNKFNPNKNIIIALIVTILVIVVISVTIAVRNSDAKTNLATSAVNDSVALIDKVLSAPAKALRNIVDSLNDLASVYEENKQLKEKLDNYDEAIIKSKNQNKEIEQLKEALNLNNTLGSYEKITANVISRSPNTWQDILIVDKGESEGVETNMAVMSQKGLVGRVIQANQRTSKVELLTTSNQSVNHFPVRIMNKDGDAFGLIGNFDKKTQTLVVTQITGGDNLKKGDVIQTSGLGGNSPANLIVGTLVESKISKDGLSREVYAAPYAPMYDISVVTIIKRMVEEGK